jgi:hypothetical protein
LKAEVLDEQIDRVGHVRAGLSLADMREFGALDVERRCVVFPHIRAARVGVFSEGDELLPVAKELELSSLDERDCDLPERIVALERNRPLV